MADAAASAVAFAWIKGNGDVAALPDTVDVGPAAVADAIADRPYAGQLFKAAMGGGDAGSDGISVVGDVNRREMPRFASSLERSGPGAFP